MKGSDEKTKALYHVSKLSRYSVDGHPVKEILLYKQKHFMNKCTSQQKQDPMFQTLNSFFILIKALLDCTKI